MQIFYNSITIYLHQIQNLCMKFVVQVKKSSLLFRGILNIFVHTHDQ